MAKMKMPKTGGKRTKPHVQMRHMKAVAPSAFPQAPMAFPPSDPTGMAGGAPPAMPGQDPTQATAAPPMAGPPAPGMMGQ